MTDTRSATTKPTKAVVAAGALAGFLAAAAGVSVATGLAALLTGVPSPIESVGNRAIDYAPPFLKDFAVDTFGTADKAVLIGGVVVTLAIVAAIAGVIGLRRPKLAYGITAAIGVVAVLAAIFDRTASASILLVPVPALLAIVVSVGLLVVMLRALELRSKAGDDLPSGFHRRSFLRGVIGASAVLILGGVVTRVFGGAAAAESRKAVNVPTPAIPADPLPAGVQPDVDGISRYITKNRDFYRVDTALSVPDVPVEGYSLRIHGMVDQEMNLSFRDLLDERLVEKRITLTCVSNEVGGPYVDNATWIGVPVRDVLERAGIQDGADAIRTTSADGWDTGTPLEAVTDDRNALIAIAMNGEPLPLEHGFPVRLVIPGLYGYVSATKWLTDLEVTRFADFTAYWTSREYDAEAPIKTSSRIDVPRSFQSFARDSVRVGGVAWAQTKGIERVEVRVDDGDWVDADLATEDNIETWRLWSWQWNDATPGSHQLTVRATDGSGYLQTSERAEIRPNGTTGWHSVQFRVDE